MKLDNAYIGGRLNGGKAGRGSEYKVSPLRRLVTGLKQRLLLRVKSFPRACLASGVLHPMDVLTSQSQGLGDTQKACPIPNG